MDKLSLKNFENYIEDKIVERGLEYFENDLVDGLEMIAAGSWTAQVLGSENYMTSVLTSKNKIKEWECDCPYDYGPVCKHVVAVFYAIRKEMELKMGANKKETSTAKKNKVMAILEKISHDELKSFFIEQFRYQADLKSAFIVKFAEYLDDSTDDKYRTIVRNLYKASQGSYGFIDYKAMKTLSKNLFELVDKANTFYKKDNLLESIAICKTLIEEIPLYLNNMDDSDGRPMDICDASFKLINRIAQKAPPMLKDDLFDYAIDEYPKEKYRNFSIENRFLVLLPTLISTNEQEDAFYKIIDNQIEQEKERSMSEYYISSIVKIKIEYLQSIGNEGEINKILNEHIELVDFRNIIVDKAIAEKNFKKAKELINDGAKVAENQRWQKNVVLSWKSRLLDVAEMENDLHEIRKWAEFLFYESHFNFEFYERLRQSYSPTDWTSKKDEIIERIIKETNNKVYDGVDALANIYVIEDMRERLLKLLTINPTYLSFIDKYAKHLVEDYRREILDLYEKAIVNHAKVADRGVYREVASFLKRMLKIEGARTQVDKIISHFRATYKNRSAMMSILNESFPRTLI